VYLSFAMSSTMTHTDLMRLEKFLVSKMGLSHHRADLAIRAVREKLLTPDGKKFLPISTGRSS
jgi:hypothetical protein